MSKSRKAILNLSWQAVAYGVGTLGSQLVSYLTLPILTHALTKEEYGAIPLLLSAFSFLNILTNAGLPAATYHYYNEDEDPRRRKFLLGGSQFLFFSFAALPAVFMFLFPQYFSTLLLQSNAYALAVRYASIALVTDSLIFFGNIILRIQMRALVSSLHMIMSLILKMGLAILFVTKYNLGVNGYWLGYLLSSIVALLVMLWLTRDHISLQFRKGDLINLVVFGSALILSEISMNILRIADRYVVSFLTGLDQVAVYDIGYKVGALLTMAIGPFKFAWNPFAFAAIRKEGAPKIFRDIFAYVTAGSVFGALGLTAFRKEIVFMLAPHSYEAAIPIVGWVAFSHIFVAVQPITSFSLVSQKKGAILSWIAASAGVLNVALCYLLIPRIGIIGAAVATLVGYAFLSVVSYVAGKRWLDMKINWRQLSKVAFAALPSLFGISVIEKIALATVFSLSLKLALLLTFPLLLLALRFITINQMQEIAHLAFSMLARRGKKGAPNEDAV
ncbi:MAG: oligosaccharide flippase family protein [Anaerolineales bacterium]|nr:oligosaccharide flippase family protein [Anaerolineales bacterium]